MTTEKTDNQPPQKHSINNYPEIMTLLLQNAISERATDIHIDSQEKEFVIRFRVDGMIHYKQTLSEEDGIRLINQLKAASGIEVQKSFFPLESQLEYYFQNSKKELRITVLPGKIYESVHLRILSVASQNWKIEQLGFTDQDQETINDTINTPYGMILISGQTGTGKTTTLYSLASRLDLKQNIAVSIEDPIEFTLPYLRQLEVDEEHGLSMYEGLRTLVRMDPDVILIGEIRDEESAVIASKAAVGGRLVLATIHAGDAARAVEALHYFTIPYHVICSSLRLIVAQQLARRLCTRCAVSQKPNEAEKKLFKSSRIEIPTKVYEAVGCNDCNHYGYKGRIGLFETIPIDKKLQDIIASGANYHQLLERFQQVNITSILEDGLKKVTNGQTTVNEIMRLF